jgi:hypothetical protein
MQAGDGAALAGMGDGMSKSTLPAVDADEMIPTERVAVVTFLLSRGHRYTTSEVGVIAGIRRDSAYKMLAKISRVLPLAGPDPDNGRRWQILPDEADVA